MMEKAINFHTKRRAFIIMPDIGLIIAPKNVDVSHEQMLKNMGFSTADVLNFLAIYPRGYFMNGELCVYQGYDMTPGSKWVLTDNGKKIVQQYIVDLCAIFNLNNDTRIYTGVVVGKIGDVWKKINACGLKTLENGNIVM